MASIVSICNLALSNIGKDGIGALNEPTAEARACNQFYGHVLSTLLQDYPWRFAEKTTSLAEVANDKPAAWARAYKRPVDCLKVLEVTPSNSGPTVGGARGAGGIGYAHEIEGGTIYCDLSPAYLRHTCAITDPSRFPPLFVEALAWALAVRLAMPLTRDPKMRADAWQIAQQTKGAAEMADANEVPATSDIDSDIVGAR